MDSQDIPRLPERKLGTRALIWLAIMLGIIALIIAAYNFYLYAENDRGIGVLIYTFALCFGLSAFAYAPLFIIANLISRSQIRPTKRQAIWTIALSVPWIPTAIIMLGYSSIIRLIGLIALIAAIIFIVWALRHLRKLSA